MGQAGYIIYNLEFVHINVQKPFIQKMIELVVYQMKKFELVPEISRHMQQKIQEIHIQELGLQHGINQLQQHGVIEEVSVDIDVILDGLEIYVIHLQQMMQMEQYST
jgi:hypothetical protein